MSETSSSIGSGRVYEIGDFNMASAQHGDQIRFESDTTVDNGVNLIGYQIGLICGATFAYTPDSKAISGHINRHSDAFIPVSNSLTLDSTVTTISDRRLVVVAPPRIKPLWQQRLRHNPENNDAPNYFHYIRSRMAYAVSVELANEDKYIQGRMFDYLGYASKVLIQKSPRQFRVSSEEDLRPRLHKAIGQLKDTPEMVHPNQALIQVVQHFVDRQKRSKQR